MDNTDNHDTVDNGVVKQKKVSIDGVPQTGL